MRLCAVCFCCIFLLSPTAYAADSDANAEALYKMGVAYMFPTHGTPTDEEGVKAVQLFQKAAEQGHARAQVVLAGSYEAGMFFVPKDNSKAMYWYQKAAEQGDVAGQRNLGRVYLNGLLGEPKDEVKAVYWYRKAAEQGDLEALLQMCRTYEQGIGGIPRDEAKAAQLYQYVSKAAGGERAIQALAEVALGRLYYYGRGVPQNDYKAAEYFRRAADFFRGLGDLWGSNEAEIFLGRMHIEGRGVIRDKHKGCRMLREAAEVRNPDKNAVAWYNQFCAN